MAWAFLLGVSGCGLTRRDHHGGGRWGGEVGGGGRDCPRQTSGYRNDTFSLWSVLWVSVERAGLCAPNLCTPLGGGRVICAFSRLPSGTLIIIP